MRPTPWVARSAVTTSALHFIASILASDLPPWRNWNLFLTLTVNGLTAGSVYALIALGYSMVYGILKLLNFRTATST